MSEARMVSSKLLVNQWRSEPSSHSPLGHELAFTKSADEPQNYDAVCPARVTSTRRFCARPWAVLFEAMGFASPKPRAEIMSGFTPFEIRYCITASARFCDSTSFEVTPSRFSAGLIGALSV